MKSRPKVTACILARNEEHRIEDALRSLQGWTIQTIVIDNESTDRTAEIARQYGALVLTAGRANNFDAIRNLAIEPAIGDWIFYLDADERVPAQLGQDLLQLIATQGEEFVAVCIPFKHYFCGKWMEHSGWWPGYTRPQLLKKEKFHYNARLHSGVAFDGKLIYFPFENPDLAIVHYSYDDLHHYLAKLNNYTDGEAESLFAANQTHSWQSMLAHFTADWQNYYECGRADLDGMHGFILSFMSAFYRFASRAKLWDLRRKNGELTGLESVPESLREMLEFMARVTQEGGQQWLEASASTPVPADVERLPLIWCAPLFDPSGYASEARNFALGLLHAEEPLSLCAMNWGEEEAGLAPETRDLLIRHIVQYETPSEIFISQTTPPLNRPSPYARFSIARTMFETDRLQPGWEVLLNRMDRIWVPSEFNRDTFVRSGVDPEKIAVIPGSLDPAPYLTESEPWPVPGTESFRFLSVFDWTLHKGWDLLLEAFAREFGENLDVGLILKVWSSNHYTLEDIRNQAEAVLLARVGKSLADLPTIHLWQERIPSDALPRLYRAVDAYVTPTRGEGWGRPLMEAMAAGLPTIATEWSAVTAFHNARVGYPLKYRLVPVSPEGAKEIPIYTGHYWAEPDVADLQRLMRQLVANPEAGKKKGLAAQKSIAKNYSHAAVTKIIREELARCRELAAKKPLPTAPQSARAAARPQRPKGPERLTPPLRPKANPIPIDPIAPVDFMAALGRKLRIRWEGDQAVLSSLAFVNRELCLGLLEAGDVELSLVENSADWETLIAQGDPRFPALFACRNAVLSGPPDVTIRHHFPPNWKRPETGKLIVMQPWEYGHLPKDWVHAAIHDADEVWVYSRFVRDVYVRSDVPAEKVRIVPLGVRPEIFTPNGPVFPLPTRKSVRFLFVGGTIARKGADHLLNAYLQAFTRQDDVCLVVKDMGTRTFYQNQNFAEAFRKVQADPNAPEIIYMDEDLSETDLAALYRACTCVVLPYRGEGFGLSTLEGMACGLPVIVTSGGPTEDYLDDSMALRVPYRIRFQGHPRVGEWECAGDPWNQELDLPALVEALRWIEKHPEESKRRGETAHDWVEAGWTWARSAAMARERLLECVAPLRERPVTAAKLWAEPKLPTNSGGKKRLKPIELSLCMIVRNEEPRIRECLLSIAPHVDEMVIIDTGSTDLTREIALECGARVFDFPWPDSFAMARNQSIEQARGKWIFWMDADDVISLESGAKLRELIRLHPDCNVAYQVQVRIPPGPGEFSPSVVDHVKLFPNHPEVRFEHRIHEQVLPSLRRVGFDVRFSDLFVTHHNYDRSPDGQRKKRLRDFRLLMLDLLDHPDHPFVLFNLGMTHLYATRDYEVAAHYVQRSLDGSDWRDSIVRKSYALLTTARICQQDWGAAIAANEAGRSFYPEDAELLFQAGQIYQQLGRFDEARQALERLATGKDDPHYQSVDTGLRTYRARHELALLYTRMGDGPHGIRTLRELLHNQPDYLPARIDLIETLHALQRTEEAREILIETPHIKGLEADLLRLHVQLGIPWKEETHHLRTPVEIPSTRPNPPLDTMSAEPDWSTAPVFSRRESILSTLRHLSSLVASQATIVETGTLRNMGDNGFVGDGWTTLAWGWYSRETEGRAYTVGIDAEALATCRKMTQDYATVLEYIEADSVAFLRSWNVEQQGPIHLLYLDSVDYEDPERSELHRLAEIETALPALADRCLVLFDDTTPTSDLGERGIPRFTGKGARAIPFLLERGFQIEWSRGGQVLLGRRTDPV